MMIVCDECRSVTDKAFECNLILEKSEPVGSKETGRTRRLRSREVVRIPVALCEKCITKVCVSLGKMKHHGTLGRWNEDPKATTTPSPLP